MKELKDLNCVEKTVLLACCDANNLSLHSHVPYKTIYKRAKNIPSKLFNKAFKRLLANGFVVKHPTRGETTYNLSKKGLLAGNIVLKEVQK